jgi:hypothetical protein
MPSRQVRYCEVKHAIQLAVRDMTIRMGAMAVALLAALATTKFFA